jgi:hypothetical protein
MMSHGSQGVHFPSTIFSSASTKRHPGVPENYAIFDPDSIKIINKMLFNTNFRTDGKGNPLKWTD